MPTSKNSPAEQLLLNFEFAHKRGGGESWLKEAETGKNKYGKLVGNRQFRQLVNQIGAAYGIRDLATQGPDKINAVLGEIVNSSENYNKVVKSLPAHPTEVIETEAKTPEVQVKPTEKPAEKKEPEKKIDLGGPAEPKDKEVKTPPVTSNEAPNTSQAVQEELDRYNQTSGREIKYTEKQHFGAPVVVNPSSNTYHPPELAGAANVPIRVRTDEIPIPPNVPPHMVMTYKNMVKELKNEWLRNNPGKSFDSPEFLAYLKYKKTGPGDKKQSLFDAAEAKFNQRYSLWLKNTVIVHRNYKDDAAIKRLDTDFKRVTGGLFTLDSAPQSVITDKLLDQFVVQHLDKAYIYSLSNTKIKAAYDRYLNRLQSGKVEPPPVVDLNAQPASQGSSQILTGTTQNAANPTNVTSGEIFTVPPGAPVRAATAFTAGNPTPSSKPGIVLPQNYIQKQNMQRLAEAERRQRLNNQYGPVTGADKGNGRSSGEPFKGPLYERAEAEASRMPNNRLGQIQGRSGGNTSAGYKVTPIGEAIRFGQNGVAILRRTQRFIPGPVRGLAVQAGSIVASKTKIFITKHPTATNAVVGGSAGFLLGYFLTNELTGGIIGAAMVGGAPYAMKYLEDNGKSGRTHGNPITNRLSRAARNKLLNQLRNMAIKRGLAMLLANPYVLVIIAIAVILIAIPLFLSNNQIFSLCPPYLEKCGASLELPPNKVNKVEITKTGPEAIDNGAQIKYEITVTNKGPDIADIAVTDVVPAKTSFVSALPDVKPAGGQADGEGGTLTWTISKMDVNKSQKIELIVKPKENDIWVVNMAEARITQTYGGTQKEIATIVKSGDKQVPNGQEINYEITVTYSGSGTADIKVTDVIPQNTTYVEGSASDGGTIVDGILTWELKGVAAGTPKKVTFKVKPGADDVLVTNNAGAAVTYTPSSGFNGGEGCPTQEQINENRASRITCRGLNPSVDLRQSDLPAEGIENYIHKYAPRFASSGGGDINEFRRRVNIIQTVSKEAGINPAILLALWISESGLGDGLGCLNNALSGFEGQVRCALGLAQGGSTTAQCLTSQDLSSRACLNELGRQKQWPQLFDPYDTKVPAETGDDFYEMYGPFHPDLERIANKRNMDNNNCIHSYNIYLEVSKEVGACKAPMKGN